jgi:thiol-disulfide isomerase/thioredoxin
LWVSAKRQVLHRAIRGAASLFGVTARVLACVALALTIPAVAAAGIFVPGKNKPAPALAGIDAIGGKQVSLARWKGRPVLVNLWGSWCIPCRNEAKELRAFLAKHPGSVLGIDVEDSKAGAKGFQRHYDVHFPSIYDPHDVLVFRLNAPGTPSTYFLDRKHRIVATLFGAGTLKLFERGWKLATG